MPLRKKVNHMPDNFPVEDIPDNDTLYHRVHKVHCRDGELILSLVFKNIDGAMSNDWSKYSTPQETKNRAKKNPENNGVLSMKVENIRSISNQIVIHAPFPENRSHTHIMGEKKEKQLIYFDRIWAWEIEPPKE
jgi:hypothetical protein